MEFQTSGLNLKITSCNEVSLFFYRGSEMEMFNIWIVSKTFREALCEE